MDDNHYTVELVAFGRDGRRAQATSFVAVNGDSVGARVQSIVDTLRPGESLSVDISGYVSPFTEGK